MSRERTYVGFGFGAIQAGLFLYEAHRSGAFSRLVVAEVVPEVVAALRAGNGTFTVNVATASGIEQHPVPNIEVLNPNVPGDRVRLLAAVAEAAEIGTALPSIRFFEGDTPSAIGALLADGLASNSQTLIYTAENHNHAAEALSDAIGGHLPAPPDPANVQCVNTVVGKMSGIVTDPAQITDMALAPMVQGIERAFLVEEFNRILIDQVTLEGFQRGIDVFEEKPDLLPFEEAKLYGHNATHALVGYLAEQKGYRYMAETRNDEKLIEFARAAFLEESGRALCARHAGVDPLFTADGYSAYVDDLMDRMTNPFLKDAVERIIRDPRRKLGWNDRLVGTMRVALSQGIEPLRFAKGAAVALNLLARDENMDPSALLKDIWSDPAADNTEQSRIQSMILTAI